MKLSKYIELHILKAEFMQVIHDTEYLLWYHQSFLCLFAAHGDLPN